MEPLFTGKDLSLINALTFDASLKPSFNVMRDCLEWKDERPDGLSPDAYDYLCDLFIARSLLHQGLTLADHPFDSAHCIDIWNRALNQVPKWPGFSRLELSDVNRSYFEKMRGDARKGNLL